MKHTGKTFLAASLYVAGAATSARAAGGHHAVDDAATIAPGQCELDTWFDREGARRLLHVGPACRVGPLDVGLNIDRVRLRDTGTSTVAGPQVKWASAVTERLSVGLAAAASWQDHAPGYLGSTLVVPISVQVSHQWHAHINLGRDFRAGQEDSTRAGAALEWAPNDAWSVIGERFREGGMNQWRFGGRWKLTQASSLDLSRAKTLGTNRTAWWTVGLQVAFDR